MDPLGNYEAVTTLQQWRNGLRIANIAHLQAASFYKLRSRVLGLPVTILSVVIGTSIFATLGSSDNQLVLIAVGVISMVAATLSGMHTFLNYSELGEKHYAAGVKYGKLRRKVEELLAFVKAPTELEIKMAEINDEWGKIEDESPTVPQRFNDKACSIVKPLDAKEQEITR
jgi:hypothetical protein